MANGKFEQLTLPFDPTPTIAGLQTVQEAVAATSSKAQVDFQKVGASAVQLGQTLTVALTLPIVAFSASAVKVGNEFELAFARMVGLANVPAAEVERLRQGVLLLGGETTKSPNELAEALYFITSSGIAAADALPILESGAKAAAAGLGRTKDVVDVTTSVINAYGKSNITAAQATDILVQAVRDGKGEPEAFAQVLGRIVPTASKLGVSFDQVAAALAVMTRTGLSASEASISLNQVFNSFLNTTKEGERVLEAHGLSLSKIRDVLKQPGGLLNALRLLDQSFGGNLETLDKVIPNIRALRGFLNILAQDAGSVGQVFANTNAQLINTNEQLGAGQEAFDAYSKTTQASINKAKVAVESALIRIGVVLAPFVEKASNFVQAIVAMFETLSGGEQTTIVIIAAVVAALGPLLIITGSLIRAVQTIVSFGPQLLAVFTNPAFLLATVVLGGLAAAFYFNAKAAAESKARVNDYTQAIREAGDVSAGVTKIIEGVFAAGKNKDLLDALDKANLKVKDLSDAVVAGGDAFSTFKQKVIAARLSDIGISDNQRDSFKKAGLSVEQFINKLARGEDVSSFINTLNPLDISAGNVAQALRKFSIELDTTSKEIAKAEDNARVLDRVLGRVDTTSKSTADSLSKLPPELQAIVDAALSATVSADILGEALATLNKATPSFALQFADGAAAVLKSTGGATNAIQALTAANKQSTSASGSATKAQDLQAASAERAAQAQQKYDDSLQSVEKAQRAVLEAQNALNEAQSGPSVDNITDLQLKATDDMLSLEDATARALEATKKLDALKSRDRLTPATRQEIDSAALEEQQALLKVLQAQQAFKKSGKALNDAQSFDPAKDQAVADAKLKVKDAETALAKQLRESKDAYDAIAKAVEGVQTAEGGRSTAIKEKYIPTIEEFTTQLGKNFLEQLNFFNNIQTLVDRGAKDLARSILSVAATDKESAAALAAQATTLTDDALAEQDRLIKETNVKNALLVEAQRLLFESLLRGIRVGAPAVQKEIIDLFTITDDELIAASGKSAGQLFMEGLIKGIGDNAAGAADAVRDGINNAIKAAREAAGIKSPSTVMALVGRQMAEGLALGIAQEQAKAGAAAKALVQSAVSAAVGAQSGLVPVGTGLARLVQPTSPLAPVSSQINNDLSFNIQIDNVTADNAEQVGSVVGESAARSYLASRAAGTLLDSGFQK